MLIREFISETNKNQMIAKILDYYGVGNVRLKQKSMKELVEALKCHEDKKYI